MSGLYRKLWSIRLGNKKMAIKTVLKQIVALCLGSISLRLMQKYASCFKVV